MLEMVTAKMTQTFRMSCTFLTIAFSKVTIKQTKTPNILEKVNS